MYCVLRVICQIFVFGVFFLLWSFILSGAIVRGPAIVFFYIYKKNCDFGHVGYPHVICEISTCNMWDHAQCMNFNLHAPTECVSTIKWNMLYVNCDLMLKPASLSTCTLTMLFFHWWAKISVAFFFSVFNSIIMTHLPLFLLTVTGMEWEAWFSFKFFQQHVCRTCVLFLSLYYHRPLFRLVILCLWCMRT